jgi:3-oxoacyl-[acyl-carrier-protein] synthase-3
MKKITAAITGVGAYLPDYLLTNDELSRMVDTSDEWIMTRIGIKTRHILKGEGLGTSYMGARAIKDLLEKTGVNPLEIDIVICATVTPDMFFPSTGNLIADQAGCKNAFAYDISAACSGFLFALTTGSQFIETGYAKKVIVVGAHTSATAANGPASNRIKSAKAATLGAVAKRPVTGVGEPSYTSGVHI